MRRRAWIGVSAFLVCMTASLGASAYQYWLRINSDICYLGVGVNNVFEHWCEVPYNSYVWSLSGMTHLYVDINVTTAGATNKFQACYTPQDNGAMFTCGGISTYSGTGYVSLQPDTSVWTTDPYGSEDYPFVLADYDVTAVSFNGMAITSAN